MDPTTLVLGPLGALALSWFTLVVLYRKYLAKETECQQIRETLETRCQVTETKYIDLLLSDIEERKDRDRTIELLTRAASNTHGGG